MRRMGRLEGQVAFVTGAGRGIGAATALRMAEEGARVALADIDIEGCQQVSAEIDRLGSESLVLPCNVTDSAMVEDAMAQAADRFGRVDILVNNAGVVRDNLLFKMSEDEWETVIDVHLKGAFLCSRAAQKYMVEQKYGRIVSLSSSSAIGNLGKANYYDGIHEYDGIYSTLTHALNI